MRDGGTFFDQPDVFDAYWRARSRQESANSVLEQPIIESLIGSVDQLAVLDLGCGDGQYGKQLLAQGAASYYGIDASMRMVSLAKKNLTEGNAHVVHQAFEEMELPAGKFDLAVSRLALHYVDDLVHVLTKVCRSLASGGRLVFSVEHPLLTSCQESQGTKQGSWVVDDYFVAGARDVLWFGDRVRKYHRSIEDYFLAVQQAGFQVEMLRESKPDRAQFSSEAEYSRRMRIPLFLLMTGRK